MFPTDILNELIFNKIFEFKLPFNFDELVKNNSFKNFEDFENMMKNYNTDNSITPNIFMVGNFAYQFSECKYILENLIQNSDSNDALVHLYKGLNVPFKML